MTDTEAAVTLFIAVLRQISEDIFVSYNPRAFAKVVEDLQSEGNPFAQRFCLYPHSIEDRKSCPGFIHGLAWALMAGLIAWEDPGYTRFILKLSPRMAQEIISESEDVNAAETFAKTYLSLA